MVSASFIISLFWGAVFNSLKRFKSCQDSGAWDYGMVSLASRLAVGVLIIYLEAETASSS